MRLQATLAATAAVGSLALGGVTCPAKANTHGDGSSAFCTWGGTPAAPTGRFTFSPGLTQFTPSSGPLKFYATGELSGGGPCQGQMVFKGVAEPGATCPEFVVDRDGRIVGSDQPQALTNYDHFTDCLRPEGFTAGNFSSLVEFYDTSG